MQLGGTLPQPGRDIDGEYVKVLAASRRIIIGIERHVVESPVERLDDDLPRIALVGDIGEGGCEREGLRSGLT